MTRLPAVRWNDAFKILLLTGVSTTIILLWSIVPAFSDEKTVIAEGVAQVQGGNSAGARHAAIQDAVRRAVEQGAGMMMDAATVLADEELTEHIRTHATGSVTDYTVMSEKQEADGLYRVSIQATVRAEPSSELKRRPAITAPLLNYPRVVLMPEAEVNVFSPLAAAVEARLRGVFSTSHLDIIGPAPEMTEHQSSGYGEITLSYTLSQRPGRFDGVLHHAAVTLCATATATDTRQIIAVEEARCQGVGGDSEAAGEHAGCRAAERAGHALVAGILSWWEDCSANGIPYLVVLATPEQNDTVSAALKDRIRSIQGVVSLTERSSGNGKTEMMVRYKSTPGHGDFKEVVLKTLHGTPGLESMKLISATGRMLVLSLS